MLILQVTTKKTGTHTTLKSAIPTSWNSVLTMVASILDLHAGVNETLKRLGIRMSYG